MKVKPGVVLDGVHFGMWYAGTVYDYLSQVYGFGEATVTGGRENAPGRVRSTLHPAGLALDFRFWSIPAEVRPAFASEVQRFLGRNYDVVLESDHIHVEYLIVT